MQGFQRKIHVIKMENVGGWAGVNVLFPEYNSATVRSILMELGRVIEQINTECQMQEWQLKKADFLFFYAFELLKFHS